MKYIITSLASIFTLLFLILAGVRISSYVEFSNNCDAYLSRAAKANTIESAKEELEKAITYAKSNNLTEGIVSIFFKNPDNDIGFWYKNMVDAKDELDNISENTSQLERTNVLMKLRESLTKNSGQSTTTPSGISVYPNNKLLFWLFLVCFLDMGICYF